MVNAQEWLDKEYPKNERRETSSLYITSNELTGSLDLSDFVNLEVLACVDNQLVSLNVNNCSRLKKINCSENNFTSLNFSNNSQLKELECSKNSRLTNLIVKNCSELQRIEAVKCQLTSLDLSNCNDLTSLSLGSNWITNIDFLNTISHPQKLVGLSLSNNNIQRTTLDIFSRFTNLKNLALGQDQNEINEYDEELDEDDSSISEIRREVRKEARETREEVDKKMLEKIPNYRPSHFFNRFYGSLKPLQNLTKLENLCIEATDIDGGLEYLSDLLNEAKYDTDTKSPGAKGRVYCSPKRRPRSKVAKIKEQLKPFGYNLGKWKENYRKLNQQQNFTQNQLVLPKN